ncbi:phage tail tube protein [Roseomonas sp. HJA6]|uniref:Phage tail tube protein n=1 Tax=Roseomonas alba TaxID=2846776 RepID=A0ABS7AIS1_9PROT|nr:phage tail tube protein [Neoroseomonas alba]MBW6402083.1 phage tail tube protein [Neoroseomonas alba]
MQTLGIIDIVWKQQKIPVEKGAKFRPGGLKQNAVVSGRRAGYAQEWQQSEITATTWLARGQTFRDLYSAGEGELQVLCDTGQTFTWSDAFLEGDRPEITGGEGGKIELRWVAGEPEEVLNG